MGKRSRGRHARLGTVTGMLHKLRKKYNKAEQIGMRKAKEEFQLMGFIKRFRLLFL